jgi:hypothetical protein
MSGSLPVMTPRYLEALSIFIPRLGGLTTHLLQRYLLI